MAEGRQSDRELDKRSKDREIEKERRERDKLWIDLYLGGGSIGPQKSGGGGARGKCFFCSP